MTAEIDTEMRTMVGENLIMIAEIIEEVTTIARVMRGEARRTQCGQVQIQILQRRDECQSESVSSFE
jgi:hypothetical protein